MKTMASEVLANLGEAIATAPDSDLEECLCECLILSGDAELNYRTLWAIKKSGNDRNPLRGPRGITKITWNLEARKPGMGNWLREQIDAQFKLEAIDKVKREFRARLNPA